mmetsp:Transcript_1019/g.2358  ORF Transcript_1019/g.2358 Transcript_1019/m.2358 type:complete len:452 (+) Transcript_1019:90-1445(+)
MLKCSSLLVVVSVTSVSMNVLFFPAIRRIGRCHAFRSAFSTRYEYEYRHEHLCRGFGNNDDGCKSFGGVCLSSTADDVDGDGDGEHAHAHAHIDEGDDDFYQTVSAYLFRQGRTWKRLSHLLTMASTDDEDKLTHNNNSSSSSALASPTSRMKSVADIGTDHGLLAMGLALTGDYDKVVGVDVSDQALTYGALTMLGKIQNKTIGIGDTSSNHYHRATNSARFPIEFRLGNGLQALDSGEADVVCIAGMGVNTMLEILLDDDDEQREESVVGNNRRRRRRMDVLERIGCKRLVLQATNSKPRNLILLYDGLQELGWKVRDERIEFLSRRWYMTTSFESNTRHSSTRSRSGVETQTQPQPRPGERSDGRRLDLVDFDLPGSRLVSLDDSDPMREIFGEYCLHHRQWITQDHAKREASSQAIDPRERRWLEYFFDEDDRPRSAKDTSSSVAMQ